MSIRLTYHNLARDAEIRDWVQHHIGPLIQETRKDRVDTEERWMHFWKIWNVELDDQSYQGRSRVYLSAGRNTLETWKIALQTALFPASDWFGVEAKHSAGLEGNAEAEKALQRENLRHMNLESCMAPFLQQYLTYGTGVLRQTFVDQEETHRFYERVLSGSQGDPNTTVIRTEPGPDEDDADALRFRTSAGTEVQLVERAVKVKYGPDARPVDLFHFFVNPTTARNVQDAILAFEDITVSLEHIEDMHRQYMDPKHPEMGRLYDEIRDLIDCKGRLPVDVSDSEQERTSRSALEVDPNVFSDLGDGFVNLSEAYWRGEIPDARDPYTGEEYGVIDWLIVLVNDIWPVRVQPNPFYRKRRPWRVARFLEVVNEFYGRGIVEPFASIQYMLNDIGNLTIDNLVSALNPIVLINDDLVSNFDSLQFAPQAKWFVDPAGVQFVNPPNVAQIGMSTMQMFTGLVQDYGQANFAVQGVPAPKGRGRSQNTAAGMAMLQSSGSAGMQAALKNLEREIMVPVLETNYELQEQFMSDRMKITQGGADGIPLIEREIGFEDVIGNYVFTWKSAQQVRERQALTQGLQGFIQMMAQIRMADPDAAAQFRFKWGPLAKRFIVDGMGLPWANEIIETPDDTKSVDPALELDLMAAHRDMKVQPGDPDEEHMAAQGAALMQEPFASDPIAQGLLMKHLMAHQEQAAAKAAAQQQQMMMQVMQMLNGGGGQQGGPPGMPSPTGPGGSPNGTDIAADAARGVQ